MLSEEPVDLVPDDVKAKLQDVVDGKRNLEDVIYEEFEKRITADMEAADDEFLYGTGDHESLGALQANAPPEKPKKIAPLYLTRDKILSQKRDLQICIRFSETEAAKRRADEDQQLALLQELKDDLPACEFANSPAGRAMHRRTIERLEREHHLDNLFRRPWKPFSEGLHDQTYEFIMPGHSIYGRSVIERALR